MSEPTTQQWQEIQSHLFAGRKIQAIKIYRSAAGVDLKDAKDAMDAYETRLRTESPDRFTAPAKSGCFGVILLAIGVLSSVAGAVANHWLS